MNLEGSGTGGHTAAVHAQNVTGLRKIAHKCLVCALGEGELWQDDFLSRTVSSKEQMLVLLGSRGHIK